jgi:transposase-like protein
MLSVADLFKGRDFDREIIILCVRWYLRFKLSYRDLVEMMAEQGISLAHTTMMRWIARNFKSVGTASPAGPAHPGASTNQCEDQR